MPSHISRQYQHNINLVPFFVYYKTKLMLNLGKNYSNYNKIINYEMQIHNSTNLKSIFEKYQILVKVVHYLTKVNYKLFPTNTDKSSHY